MKTSARLLVLLGLISLIHDFGALGNQEGLVSDTSSAAAIEPEPTQAPDSNPPVLQEPAIRFNVNIMNNIPSLYDELRLRALTRDRSYHYPHVGHHHHEDPTYQGFWKKKFVWRPRWVKTWQEKKIYVAVWKRMWGPAEVKEWVPVPKPPPGWVKHAHGNYFIKTHH